MTPTSAKGHMPFPHRNCAEWVRGEAETWEVVFRHYADPSGFRASPPRNKSLETPRSVRMTAFGKERK